VISVVSAEDRLGPQPRRQTSPSLLPNTVMTTRSELSIVYLLSAISIPNTPLGYE